MSPGELREKIARNVRREREAQGLSQRDLAAAAGITQKQVSFIENASVNVTVDTLEAIAKALRIPAHRLTQ